MEAPEPHRNGDVVRQYQFIKTLGMGSFGKVKLALDLNTNEKVAIKIVEKEGITDVDDVERVYRETFILTTLKHENIIRLHEVFDTKDCIMLAMEYADGGELLEYVTSKTRLLEQETCRIFHQIIAGVEYCHRAKIIHRDLKLENILMDSEKNIKIADFGLSNTIKFGQKMDTNCGTPSYTPPEQIEGGKYVGSAADMWSMGVILFAMVCGFLPFEADSIPALYKKIQKRKFVSPDYISQECRDLLDRMFVLDPEKRCTIAELRNHPWFIMEFTDLKNSIDSVEVTAEEIAKARKICVSAGDVEVEHKPPRRSRTDRLDKLLPPTVPERPTSRGPNSPRGREKRGSPTRGVTHPVQPSKGTTDRKPPRRSKSGGDALLRRRAPSPQPPINEFRASNPYHPTLNPRGPEARQPRHSRFPKTFGAPPTGLPTEVPGSRFPPAQRNHAKTASGKNQLLDIPKGSPRNPDTGDDDF